MSLGPSVMQCCMLHCTGQGPCLGTTPCHTALHIQWWRSAPPAAASSSVKRCSTAQHTAAHLVSNGAAVRLLQPLHDLPQRAHGPVLSHEALHVPGAQVEPAGRQGAAGPGLSAIKAKLNCTRRTRYAGSLAAQALALNLKRCFKPGLSCIAVHATHTVHHEVHKVLTPCPDPCP